MNIRKTEIEKFLKVDLAIKVREALASFASKTSDVEARILEIQKICDEVGIEVLWAKWLRNISH